MLTEGESAGQVPARRCVAACFPWGSAFSRELSTTPRAANATPRRHGPGNPCIAKPMARPHFDGTKLAAEAAPTPTNHEVLPMAEITASLVKELRERTGAGMMECKKALTETGGDVDAAAELLRQSGLAKADQKAGRVPEHGREPRWERGGREG